MDVDTLNTQSYISNVTPLIYAVDNDSNDIAIALINRGVNLDLREQNGYTALIIASHGYIEVLNALIAAGADINLQNNEGETALMIAASNNDLTMVNALIAAGANPNLRDNNYESNAVDFAARAETETGDNTHIDVIIALQNYINELQANTDSTSQLRQLYLHIIDNEIECAINLINIMDVDTLNTQSYISNVTPLIYAVDNNSNDIAIALINRGVNLDLREQNGYTALSRALTIDNMQLVNILLEAGADSTIQDNYGNSPADVLGASDSGESYYYDGMIISEKMSPRRC